MPTYGNDTISATCYATPLRLEGVKLLEKLNSFWEAVKAGHFTHLLPHYETKAFELDLVQVAISSLHCMFLYNQFGLCSCLVTYIKLLSAAWLY